MDSLPVEVLAHIFKYLPNQDIHCGVSLVCKQFYEISRDESLVPVKDLKIKALNWPTVNKLLRKTYKNCPKLIHLEIVATFAQSVERDVDGDMAKDGCEYLFLILKLTIEVIFRRRNNSTSFL